MLEDKEEFKKSACCTQSFRASPCYTGSSKTKSCMCTSAEEKLQPTQEPGSARTIHLDTKHFNIQSKDKRSSWTHKRSRALFSAVFRELAQPWAEKPVCSGWHRWGLGCADGSWLLLCAEHTHHSSTGALGAPQCLCLQKGRKHTKAGAGRCAGAPYLRIAVNKSRQGGGRRGAGCEGKITQLIEEKIFF